MQSANKTNNTIGSECHVIGALIADLHSRVRSLSPGGNTQPLLGSDRLVALLSELSCSHPEIEATASDAEAAWIAGLRWLVAAKATTQTLGLMMRALLDRTLILGDEIVYWDDVLASFWRTAAYTVQTSPAQLWEHVKMAYSDQHPLSRPSVSSRWVDFYERLRRCVQPPQPSSLGAVIPAFFFARRSKVRQKRRYLKDVKTLQTSSIGILMEECLAIDLRDNISNLDSNAMARQPWRHLISKSVIMMEKILHMTADPNLDLEQVTMAAVEREADVRQSQIPGNDSAQQVHWVTGQLVHILGDLLPNNINFSTQVIGTYGRPSIISRYWLPMSLCLFTSSTLLQIWASQRAKVINWVIDIGSTTVQFWRNWVVEPTEKLIKTIRHDEGSEIALMSKNSLEADRASLERMVVDFVVDRDTTQGHGMADPDAITIKVREGDLTPVLKAYERDLRAPLAGTVRGDLIRTLLIQIQKTKVDVEVAMSGIDALLKSQELVFGYESHLFPGKSSANTGAIASSVSRQGSSPRTRCLDGPGAFWEIEKGCEGERNKTSSSEPYGMIDSCQGARFSKLTTFAEMSAGP